MFSRCLRSRVLLKYSALLTFCLMHFQLLEVKYPSSISNLIGICLSLKIWKYLFYVYGFSELGSYIGMMITYSL